MACERRFFFFFLLPPSSHSILDLLLPSPPSQLGILRTQWWVILLCAIFQYVHGIFTQLAYRVHQPAPEPLPDLGFKVLPVSERDEGERHARVRPFLCRFARPARPVQPMRRLLGGSGCLPLGSGRGV